MPFDLKSLKSLFVVEEAGAPASPAARPQQPAQPSAAEPAYFPTASAGQPGQASPKFMEVLLSAMEKANLPGVDYLEYRQSLKSLEKMPMDEQVRFQSAFAMAQAMGTTSQRLVESAGHYLSILKSEETKFAEALRNQTTDRIGNRQEVLKNLDAAIKSKTDQIKKLTQDMEQHRLEMEKVQAEIKDATQKVEVTKNDFAASYQAVVAQISGDVEKMKKYLG